MRRPLPAALLVPAALAVFAACGGPSSTASSTSAASTPAGTGAPAAVDSPSASAGTSAGTSASPAAVQPSGSGATASTQAATGTSPAPSTSAPHASSASGTGSPAANGASGAATSSKKFATAKLPAKVDGYTGAVQKQGAGQSGMYTGATQDDMLMVQLNPISATGELTRLSSAQVIGDAHCGKSTDGSGAMTCVVPLQGGSLVVQGTDKSTAQQLAKATNDIVATLP